MENKHDNKHDNMYCLEIRRPAVLNALRDYLAEYKSKSQVVASIFLADVNANWGEMVNFSAWFAAAVNRKLGTAIPTRVVDSWFFEDILVEPNGEMTRTEPKKIWEISVMSIPEQISFLNNIDNRVTTRIL